MAESNSLLTVVISGTIVLLTLALGIIVVIIFQQRRVFALQKSNLDQLAESEKRYRRLVQLSPFPLIVTVDNIIVFINDASLRLLDAATEDDLYGRSVFDFIMSDFERREDSRFPYILEQNQEVKDVKGNLEKLDGQIIDIELTAIPIVYGEKEARHIVIRDITQQERQKAELIAAKERAEQSDKLKDAFIANISHEIRTPLHIIIGYSNLITNELVGQLYPEMDSYFQAIRRGSQRLMRTVEHILNISSIQVGTFSVQPEEIRVSDRIEELVQELKSLAHKKGLLLNYSTECPAVILYADRYCIDQAVSNVIDNAIKFTKKGQVDVRVYCQDRRVCIEIADTGIGMAPEYLPKVFSTFSQEASGYTRPFDGLGLGLSLTKKYVELNRGSISVKSRKGKGSTFTLQFLAERVEEALVLDDGVFPDTVPLEPLLQTPQVEGLRTVLFVEDDEETQEYMASLLAREYNLRIASTAAQAWGIIESTHIDLVLMDLSLQGDEDGISLTKRIRHDQRFGTTPIIAVTAHAFPKDRIQSLEAGCNAYFSKPFQIEELKKSMEGFLRSENKRS
ncbi:MAG: response regulator [Bacteroidetes bacterium]|nr:response regulator [Bacteroidota bacterium]